MITDHPPIHKGNQARKVRSLLMKTEANGCTPGEASSAIRIAGEIVAKYGLDRTKFDWPVSPEQRAAEAAARLLEASRAAAERVRVARRQAKEAQRRISEHWPAWNVAKRTGNPTLNVPHWGRTTVVQYRNGGFGYRVFWDPDLTKAEERWSRPFPDIEAAKIGARITLKAGPKARRAAAQQRRETAGSAATAKASHRPNLWAPGELEELM